MKSEIQKLVEQRNFAALKQKLAAMEAADIAELVGELDGKEMGVVFRLLSTDKAAEVFSHLSLDKQERLIEILSGEAMVKILNEMSPDDRTELFEELPEDVAQRLIGGLSWAERQVAIDLLKYPEHSVGRLMTPEFVTIKPNWTVKQALEHIRKVAPQKETINVVYVVDSAGRLIDDLELADLVLADPDATVDEIIDRHPVALLATADQTEAVDMMKKYDAVALPVVDDKGVLVGIVTIDDVMDVAEEEDTEDFQKMSAVVALEEPYFATTIVEMLRKRLPWLALLFCAELLTVLALNKFESRLDVAIFALTVLFMPLINSTAGNTGSQMAGLVIRGLAVHEMRPSHWWRILGRELLTGGTMGLTLGLLGTIAAVLLLGFRQSSVSGSFLMLSTDLWIKAIGVGVSIAVAVTVANIIGAMIPLVFQSLGLDPAVTSGPFLASIMDVTGVVIYFTIASSLLMLLKI